MRTLAIVVLAAALVGCGGDGGSGSGEDRSSSTPAVVTSADGRAELTLPVGVASDGVTLDAVEVEGAVVAYDLAPSGLQLDEPATLTIHEVPVPTPEDWPLAVAIVASDDGSAEPVDVETQFEAGTDVATVVLTVPHFSWAGLWWQTPGLLQGNPTFLVGSVRATSPETVSVGTPFDVDTHVRVHLGDFGYDQRDLAEDMRTAISTTAARLRGSFRAVNATPAAVDDAPALGPISSELDQVTSFRCSEAGPVTVSYLARVEVDYLLVWQGRERSGTFVNRVRVRAQPECLSGEEPTSSTSSSSTTAPAKPLVSEIRVTLRVPVTTYQVFATEPDGRPLDYVWRMSGEDCGTPRGPWTIEHVPFVDWSHADAPPDRCHHLGTDHDVTVSVTVSSPVASVTCTFTGTESRVISNPGCV